MQANWLISLALPLVLVLAMAGDPCSCSSPNSWPPTFFAVSAIPSGGGLLPFAAFFPVSVVPCFDGLVLLPVLPGLFSVLSVGGFVLFVVASAGPFPARPAHALAPVAWAADSWKRAGAVTAAHAAFGVAEQMAPCEPAVWKCGFGPDAIAFVAPNDAAVGKPAGKFAALAGGTQASNWGP